MRAVLSVADGMARRLRAHLFQNELEQGAFLFGHAENAGSGLRVTVSDMYLVPPEGWEVQHEVYLQLRDSERAKIMQMARTGGFSLIDCHSHPDSGTKVSFSPSDIAGISEFASYVQWKLGGTPYVAMAWGEASVDAVFWANDFARAYPLSEVVVTGSAPEVLIPNGGWFRRQVPYWRGKRSGR